TLDAPETEPAATEDETDALPLGPSTFFTVPVSLEPLAVLPMLERSPDFPGWIGPPPPPSLRSPPTPTPAPDWAAASSAPVGTSPSIRTPAVAGPDAPRAPNVNI